MEQDKEIQQIHNQMTGLMEKFDRITGSLNEIKLMLSRQEGEQIPFRVSTLESKITELKTYQDIHYHLPNQVEENRRELRAIWRFIYLLTGALVVLQVLVTIFGRAISDSIFK